MQDHTIKKQTKSRKHGRNRHESTTAADTQRMSDAVALPFTHLTRKRVLANRCRIIIPYSVVACDAKKKKKKAPVGAWTNGSRGGDVPLQTSQHRRNTNLQPSTVVSGVFLAS